MPGFVDPHTHLLRSTGDPESAQQAALENGITTLAEVSCYPDLLAQMQSLEQAGGLRVRTSLYLTHVNNCGEVQGDWYKQHPPTRARGEMLRIGGVKIFTDGGSCGGPAVSYDHPVFGYGDLWFTQEELNAMIAGIQAAGYQAAIHALGDRAVDQALNAIEFALNGGPNTPRHRIEHNAVVRDDMLARYSEVDPVALIFGAFSACGPPVVPPPPANQSWEWRWPDLVTAHPGGHFAWHSDRGAARFPLPPLMHLYSMVTPFEVDVDGQTTCDTPDWLAHKMLTVEQVLPTMTIEAAYALFRDEEVGSLRSGKLADLIILSGDPLTVAPDAIKDLEVWMTMVGGRVEHCAPGHEALCPGW
jgi:predicted amidohydrolase YtcJ